MFCPKMRMYDGGTVLQNLIRSPSYCPVASHTVILVPLFEAVDVHGFITSLAHHPRFELFLQSVVAVDAVTLLVRHGHGTSTNHRLSSAVLVTSPPPLRRLALHVTQKYLRYLDDKLYVVKQNNAS